MRVAAAGTVVFAGLLAGRGVVSVQHADGLRRLRAVAQFVAAGTPVGPGACSARSPPGTGLPGGVLHWGVRRGLGNYLDPLC